jgi:hypothetical protein
MTPAESLQLQESYLQLQASLARLRELAAESSNESAWMRAVRHELPLFCEELTRHFELLDVDDYISEVEVHAPQYHERLMHLPIEQRLLLKEAATLEADVQTHSPAKADMLHARLRQLLAHVQDHESRKNILILDAFNAEPGALD